jgi:hypothetical protein
MSYALVRPARLDVEAFARATQLHPELVARLIRLGLLEVEDDPGGLRLAPSQIARMARIQRLRVGFSLNYAALGLVLDLLDRISALEAAQRGRLGGQESRRGYESPDPEIAGSPARRSDKGASVRAHRG